MKPSVLNVARLLGGGLDYEPWNVIALEKVFADVIESFFHHFLLYCISQCA